LLEPGRPTLGNLLQAAGYRTAAVGKWHLGMEMPLREGKLPENPPWAGDPGIDFGGKITDSPVHHGFDEYFGVSASLDMAPYVYVRNDGFTMQPTLQQPGVRFPHFVRPGPRAEDFVIDQVLDKLTEEATSFIERAAKGDEPFFLYLPLTAPHKPTQPHERFRGKTKLSEYGDFVAQVDWTVGRVLDALDKAQLADSTLVIYTSDNGSYMFRYDDNRKDHTDDASIQGFRAENHRANGPFRGTKADIWEAGHHVPLFMRWPGRVKPAARCDATVCLTDVYATLAEIVGKELTDGEAEDSVSLLPMLRGKRAERGVPVIHHSVAGMFAIRDGRWKLIAGNGSGGRQQPRGKPFGKPYQLFDMQADPAESQDVAADHPDIVRRLTEELERIRKQGRSVTRR
jgi:arylsulfatase A-like enzyme